METLKSEASDLRVYPAWSKRIVPTETKYLQLEEQVLVDYCTWQKINNNLEIGGYGHVVQVGDSFICDKIWFLTTSHSSASMHISSDAMNKFILDRMREGYDLNEFFLHWHTHDGFNPYFSGTDLQDIASQLEILPKLVTVVFSTPSNCVARYNTRQGFYDLDIVWNLEKYLKVYDSRPQRFAIPAPKRPEISKTSIASPDREPEGNYIGWSWSSWELDFPSPDSDGDREFIQSVLFNNL
jgi:proteasome lid subunit RPN8/RPN11